MAERPFTILPHLPPEHVPAAARILYAAFARKIHKLELMTDDRDRVLRLLEAGLNPAHCLAAVDGEQLLGLITLKHGQAVGFDYPPAALRRAFGPIGALPRLFTRQVLHWINNPPADALQVDMLAVAPQARGRGVGTALLQEAFDLAAQMGCDRVMLEVVDTNPRAKALYERLGFRVTHFTRTGLLTRAGGFTGAFEMTYRE